MRRVFTSDEFDDDFRPQPFVLGHPNTPHPTVAQDPNKPDRWSDQITSVHVAFSIGNKLAWQVSERLMVSAQPARCNPPQLWLDLRPPTPHSTVQNAWL